MAKLIKAKGTKSIFMEALGIAVIKNFEERLLAPIVGNGSFGSGIVKAIIGVIVPSVGGNNKYTKAIASAFIIDSAEDLVNAVMGALRGGATTSTDNWS